MTRLYSFFAAVGLAAATALPAFAQQAPAYDLVSRSDLGYTQGPFVAAVPRAAGGMWYIEQLSLAMRMYPQVAR